MDEIEVEEVEVPLEIIEEQKYLRDLGYITDRYDE